MSDEYIEADMADMDREHNDCPAVLTVDIPASAALRICVRASGDSIVCNFDELPLLIGALELSLKRLMST